MVPDRQSTEVHISQSRGAQPPGPFPPQKGAYPGRTEAVAAPGLGIRPLDRREATTFRARV